VVSESPDPAPGSDDTSFSCSCAVIRADSNRLDPVDPSGDRRTHDARDCRCVSRARSDDGQRISRAKAKIRESNEPFELPPESEWSERLRSVLHVLYLLFSEGYTTSGGDELTRTDLSGEPSALLGRPIMLSPGTGGHRSAGSDAPDRRPTTGRTDSDGALIPLLKQDAPDGIGTASVRAWHSLRALEQHRVGEYQLQAAIAAVHDQARLSADTDWSAIQSLYARLEHMTGNPMVRLNRSVAVSMLDGPRAGLELLDGLADRLGGHHRFHAFGHTSSLRLETPRLQSPSFDMRRKRLQSARALLPSNGGRPARRVMAATELFGAWRLRSTWECSSITNGVTTPVSWERRHLGGTVRGRPGSTSWARMGEAEHWITSTSSSTG